MGERIFHLKKVFYGIRNQVDGESDWDWSSPLGAGRVTIRTTHRNPQVLLVLDTYHPQVHDRLLGRRGVQPSFLPLVPSGRTKQGHYRSWHGQPYQHQVSPP